MLSTILRQARKRAGLSCASVDKRARLLPGTCQLIERRALNLEEHDVLHEIAMAIEQPNGAAGLALYVELLLAAGLLAPADIEAWVECQARRAA